MANDEQNSKAKLISDCYIKPKYVVVPRENRPCFNLLAMELLLLSMDYMQRGFLFSQKPAALFDYLDKLKNSMSYALDYYYPLAGRFVTVRYEDEKACSIYVDPEKGPGARFIHASAAVSVSDVASYSAHVLPVVRSFFELGETGVIDYDGHTRALVSMQVTELDDGMFIGFTMNHSVADGTSLWHFIGSLSEIFNSLDEKMTLTSPNISRIPVFKPVLPPGYSLIQKLPFLELPEEYHRGRAELDDQLLEKSFHFSAASLARLKERANEEVLSIGLGKTMQISSFQALAAHVWISINRARDAPYDQPTTCFVPVDSRARFNPPLSSDHFGALVHPVWPTRTVGELMEKGLGWTAAQIHEAITTYNEEAVMSTLKTFMDRPFVLPLDEPSKSSDKQKPSLVRFAGSMRFDVYRPEFGLGKAIAVPTGYSGKIDGKVTMNMSREGGGSVDLEICLSSDNMLSLESDENFMSSTS